LTKQAKNILDRTYVEQVQTNEIPLCLAGTIKDSKIIVTNVYPAEVIMSNDTAVDYVSCPVYFGLSKVIGTIHNHPSGYCLLSDTDLKTYTKDKQRGQEIIALYCGEYVFYALTKMELTFDNE
jgi:proteasome lid subunit RPN8/RPN11